MVSKKKIVTKIRITKSNKHTKNDTNIRSNCFFHALHLHIGLESLHINNLPNVSPCYFPPTISL